MSSATLDDTVGAVVVGTVLSVGLYGIALHQAYQYYINYPHDKPLFKTYVAATLVLETIATGMTIDVVYFYTVRNYNNPVALNDVPWSFSMVPLFAVAIVVVSQIFFLYRVWILCERYKILIIGMVSIFMAAEFGVSIIASFYAFKDKTWSLLFSYVWTLSVHNACSAVADLIVTGVLIHALRQNKTGIKSTNGLISTLILYAVSTNAVTGIYNVLSFILSVVWKDNLVWYATMMIGIKLYTNSVLAALNSRLSISSRHHLAVIDTTPFGVSIQREPGAHVHERAIQPDSAQTQFGSTMANGSNDLSMVKINTSLTRYSSQGDLSK